jgi:hypothetical protein
VLEAVFILLEFSSPSRRIFIGSHSLPPLSGSPYLSDQVMHHVIRLKTPKEIWDKLETQFMSKTVTTKLYLKQKLYGLKMQEGSDLAGHINVFSQMVTDLEQLGVKIETEDKAIILLCSRTARKASKLTILLQRYWLEN